MFYCYTELLWDPNFWIYGWNSERFWPTHLVGLTGKNVGTLDKHSLFPADCEIVGSAELRKRRRFLPSSFLPPLFLAPPTLRVLFTFASPPLSESREQATINTVVYNAHQLDGCTWSIIRHNIHPSHRTIILVESFDVAPTNADHISFSD